MDKAAVNEVQLADETSNSELVARCRFFHTNDKRKPW